MTPFWLYFPLALTAFTLMDCFARRKPKWLLNSLLALFLFGVVWAIEKGS